MEQADVKKLVRQYNAAVNNDDEVGLAKVFDARIVWHDPLAGDVKGVAGIREFINEYREAFPDMRVELDPNPIIDGDRIALRWTITGTHTGVLMGIEPTNRKVSITGMEIDRIRNGRIAEVWQQWDAYGFFHQLDAVPDLVGAAQQSS